MNKTLIIGLAGSLALIAGVVAQQISQPSAVNEQTLGRLSFSYPDINGQLQSVDQWRGKILVINFWASWCGPCLEEIPEFIRLQQQFQSKNVQFVGIAIEDRQPVADYLQRININYPVLIAGDAGSLLARQLGNVINAVPFTVIVNQQGQIIHRQPGDLSREQFLQVVEPLLAQNSQNT
jgi:thiol-disulfide isomerase/thioredoxin